jgi:hypothetical protein
VTAKLLSPGDRVVIHCESCEPEPAVVLKLGRICPDCSDQQYRLETVVSRMIVSCCASILRPLH